MGQDHLGSTTTILTDTGGASGRARYHAYGLTASSEGTIPTEKKFTGQKLDETGLYFYNARYYDATIGRFISADFSGPNYSNPQALNRYSYTGNNPLKYTDPLGLDYVILGGTGQSLDDLLFWYGVMIQLKVLDTRERAYFLEDKDVDPLGGWEVAPRLKALYEKLSEGLSNVKLLGFSEGAATIATFLSQLADDPIGTAAKMGKTSPYSIDAAVLLEATASGGASLLRSLNDKRVAGLPTLSKAMYNLPRRLANAGFGRIALADVWNDASSAHGGPIYGWGDLSHSADMRTNSEKQADDTFVLGWVRRARNSPFAYHGRVMWDTNSLQVVHNTFRA